MLRIFEIQMAKKLWVDVGKGAEGPFSTTHVREMASKGRLLPDHLVSQDGSKWVLASRIRGIEFSSSQKRGGESCGESPRTTRENTAAADDTEAGDPYRLEPIAADHTNDTPSCQPLAAIPPPKKPDLDTKQGASHPPPANRFERLLALFAAVAVCAVLLLLIFPRANWQSTAGRVEKMKYYREYENKTSHSRGSHTAGETHYKFIKEYRITSTYKVDDRSYTFTAIGQQNKGEGVFVGGTIPVYYHPNKPSRASYSGNPGRKWRLILAGIIFLAVVATLIGFVQTTGSQIPSTFEFTATAIITCPTEEVWAIIYKDRELFGRAFGHLSIQAERQNEFLVREIQYDGGGKSVHSVRLVPDQSGCEVSCKWTGKVGNGFLANLIKVMNKYFGKGETERAARYYLESVAAACPAEIQFLKTAGRPSRPEESSAGEAG